MSNLEKINIYVPEHIGNSLDNDATMFEVFKRDGQTINRNKFLSMLILGYHNSYVEECSNAYNNVIKLLSNGGLDPSAQHEIADGILKNVVLPQVPSRKGKNPAKLSLKPTKETEGLLLGLVYNIGIEDSVSQYLCRLLMSYCEKPLTVREKIVFRDNYEYLQSACERKRTVAFSTIWNPDVIHEVIPYKLVYGREEMYNYLLCGEISSYSGQMEAKSYRLNRITRLSYGRTVLQLRADVERHLQMMIKYGPQFMINDDEETCVRLTEKGRKSFNRIYYGRPRFSRIEECGDDYLYYFNCSKDQILMYFRRFGPHEVEIISPESLREKMIAFHTGALDVYK